MSEYKDNFVGFLEHSLEIWEKKQRFVKINMDKETVQSLLKELKAVGLK